jgi:hypothetical protein
MPGKIWPWIHLPDCYSLVGAQAQSSSCSEGHAIDGMPTRAAYKGPNIPINTQLLQHQYNIPEHYQGTSGL